MKLGNSTRVPAPGLSMSPRKELESPLSTPVISHDALSRIEAFTTRRDAADPGQQLAALVADCWLNTESLSVGQHRLLAEQIRATAEELAERRPYLRRELGGLVDELVLALENAEKPVFSRFELEDEPVTEVLYLVDCAVREVAA